MADRRSYTDDRRQAERAANRERMRLKRLDPSYRATVNARRAARDAERKLADPHLRPRLTESSKRYFEKRKQDPEFWRKRHEYLKRWRAERRIDEEFEDFMNRMEGEDAKHV